MAASEESISTGGNVSPKVSSAEVEIEDVPDEQEGEENSVPEYLQTLADLRNCSREIEEELKINENKSVKKYMWDQEMINTVQNDVTELNETLARMENKWIEMENNLDFIKKSLAVLQPKSIALSRDLNQRLVYRDQLVQYLNDLDVAALIPGIMNLKVSDEAFLARWQEFNTRFNMMTQESFDCAESFQRIQYAFTKLRRTAILQMAEFLLDRMSRFVLENSHFYTRQTKLMKYRGLYEFILSNEEFMARSIIFQYTEIMSETYLDYFLIYGTKITELQADEKITESDVMGLKVIENDTSFELGSRDKILAEEKLYGRVMYPRPDVLHNKKFPFEVIFRNIQFAVVYNVCRECSYISDFFRVTENGANYAVYHIFEEALKLLEEHLSTSLSLIYDCITIILSFHVVLRYRIKCREEGVTTLNQYWDHLQNMSLDRFRYVVNLHIVSIRDYDVKDFNLALGRHYVSKRYAEFAATVYTINKTFPNEDITKTLGELQQEVENFISRLADLFTEKEERLIFVINNYDIILCKIVSVLGDDSEEVKTLKNYIALQAREYAEIALHPRFQQMINYVQQYEKFLGHSQIEQLKTMENQSMEIVQDFTANWKASLEDLQRDITLSFLNLNTGCIIFQITLTQLIQFFNRFHMVLSPEARSQMVSVRTIIAEFDKYKLVQY